MHPIARHTSPVQFGKYLLIDRIASGGMAELFLAKQTGLKGFEKAVAIKRILPMLTQDPEFVSMFINEAKLAALLSHQNIVQIFDLGTTEGFYYIAMEYVMGKDLRTVIQRSQQRALPLTAGHALLIASRVCSGLDHAHRKKDLQGRDLHLVHRDISPQNILLSYEGEIKLVDFGIAKAATQTNETRTGTLKGKLAYMSPEQATGQPVDQRSDIFSLGIVLYELVTGQRLFGGNNEFAILEQVRQARIAPPSQHVPDLPPEVETLIMTALAKEPTARFQHASDMERAIEQVIGAQGYAFSSLSLANYVQAVFEQDIADDTQRLQRISTITDAPSADQPTVVRSSHATPSVVNPRATPGAYNPYALKNNPPAPTRHPLLKTLLVLIAVVVWGGLFVALWRPELLPPNLPERTSRLLHKQADRWVALVVPESPPDGRQMADVRPRSLPMSRGRSATTRPPVRPTVVPTPERPAAERLKERRQFYDEARAAYQSGDLVTAEEKLRQALSISPQLPQNYHQLAKVLQERRNPDGAVAILSEGTHRYPDSAILHYDLGLLYAEKNIASLAVQELSNALDLDPTASWAQDATMLIEGFGVTPAAASSPAALTTMETP